MRRIDRLIPAAGLIIAIAAALMDPAVLLDLLQSAFSPDGHISAKLAGEIRLFTRALAIWGILVAVSGPLIRRLAALRFASPRLRGPFLMFLAINTLMLTHNGVVLAVREYDMWHKSDATVREYVQGDSAEPYAAWIAQLPEDARILAVNHDHTHFLSYYLYPRKVFIYKPLQPLHPPVAREDIPAAWLMEQRIGWIIEGNTLTRVGE